MAPEKTPVKKAVATKASPTSTKTTPKKTAAKKATPRPTKKTVARKAPAKRAPRPRRPTARDKQVLELRRAGVPFDKIATQLRYPTPDAAADAFERALAETLPQPAEQVRQLELDRLERLMTPLWPRAMRGDHAAIAQLMGLSVQRTHVAADGRPLPEADKGKDGPNEKATKAEIARLHVRESQLSASALHLARGLDKTDEGSVASATLARELRMTMQTLRGLAGTASAPTSGSDQGTGTVVPQSRLQEAREKAQLEATERERARRG
jgi:hypothetical protein